MISIWILTKFDTEFTLLEFRRSEFLDNVQLARMATIENSLRNSLEKRVNKSRLIINQEYRNSQSNFINVLKKLNKKN